MEDAAEPGHEEQVFPMKRGSGRVARAAGSPGAALGVLGSLYFIFGFITCLNDILVPHLKGVFRHVDATLPKYLIRAFGCDAPIAFWRHARDPRDTGEPW